MKSRKQNLVRFVAFLVALWMLPGAVLAESDANPSSDWVSFLLICNEGMTNSGGNAGNTLMVISVNPTHGDIRLMMFTWDTFIDYPGYDMPQKLDTPYRNNGPEEAMRVFNLNFGTNIEYFMSLNYLNLASLIDNYGGVTVDITRAERNALNGMVGSKKNQLQAMAGSGLLTQSVLDMLAGEYYLSDFGPDTHLNGLQAVGFGWLQYDSVYNCCQRDAAVISALFRSVRQFITSKAMFYASSEAKAPELTDGRRLIDLDNLTDEDYTFLRQQIAPIFQMAYHNMPEEKIAGVARALARIAYEASREGVDIFSDSLQTIVLPVEAQEPYDMIGGAKGHVVDKDRNHEAIQQFLYRED